MISHEHKCIFIHIPKCGGTSLTEVIWPGDKDVSQLWMGLISRYHNKYQTGGLQHLLARHVRQEVGAEVFNEYFKFSIIRNPWDKVVSQFAFMRHRPDLREFIGMDEDDSFKTYLDLIKRRLHVLWEHQHRFVLDEHGELMVDHIGRFEDFDTAAAQILGRLGLEAKVPHLNPTIHRPYRKYYDEEAIEMVRSLYGEDIRLFGYRFDDDERMSTSHIAPTQGS